MSDKFFFKGRQDARESYIQYGHEAKAKSGGGSKKYPLDLVVTNEERKREVEVLAAEAQLYVRVHVDTSEGAVESTAELTAQLNKKGTVSRLKQPLRNEPCVCGSGKKYKKCCG